MVRGGSGYEYLELGDGIRSQSVRFWKRGMGIISGWLGRSDGKAPDIMGSSGAPVASTMTMERLPFVT
jgi:hypothetical protein